MPSTFSIGRLLLPAAVVVSAVAVVLALYRPAAAQTGGADAPFAPGARENFIPILESLQADGSACPIEIVVQSVGDQPSKGILVYWGASDSPHPDQGPLKVECTGLIAPGEGWRVNRAMIPVNARSAAIYSATTETLSEIGVDLGFEDVVADFLCETLFFSIIGNAADALRFQRAARDGGEFAGLPMDRVLGAPLAVLIDRRCDDGSIRYAGVSSAEALADLSATSTVYEYSSPMLGASPARSGTPHITAMNVGLEVATVQVFTGPNLVGASPEPDPLPLECPPRTACGTFSVLPGESVVVDPVEAGCLDEDGTAWLESDQPLAVIVDGFGPAGRTSAAARRVNTAGTGASTGSGDVAPRADAAIDRLSAPLVYHDYHGWSTVIHIANTVDREVGARIYIKDQLGYVVNGVTIALCPLGGRSVRLDAGDALEMFPNFVGTASIESIGDSSGAAGPDVLSVTVELIRSDEAGEPVAAAAYEVRPAEYGDALISVPSVFIDSAGGSILAIQNRVTAPGFTDFRIALFDPTGILDYRCVTLKEGEVEYIDMAAWIVTSTSTYLTRGYKGSAVISAYYWEHDDSSASGTPDGNLVGLGAVLLETPPMDSPLAAPTISDGPANAIMPPAFSSSFGAPFGDFMTCPPGTDPPPIDRTPQIYLPNVANGIATALDSMSP